MPIPTAEDRKLAEIDDRYACIVTRLQVLRYAGDARDTRGLRQQLQDYADAVVAFVNELDE